MPTCALLGCTLQRKLVFYLRWPLSQLTVTSTTDANGQPCPPSLARHTWDEWHRHFSPILVETRRSEANSISRYFCVRNYTSKTRQNPSKPAKTRQNEVFFFLTPHCFNGARQGVLGQLVQASELLRLASKR
eukprot:1260107-Amphidinium_carterae.1